jgi:acyl-CoA thioesterase II
MDLDQAEEAELVNASVHDLVDAIAAVPAPAARDTAPDPHTDTATADADPDADPATATSPHALTFVTTSPNWWIGGRTFGGMVVAQALSAAFRTAPAGSLVHSLHGYFLRPTSPGARTVHTVVPVRDGRSFSTREVVSTVDGAQTFRMTCSFHLPEEGDEYQLPMPPGIERPSDVAGVEAPFPFDIRELGATERRRDGTYESTRRCWFRTRERLPDDPAVHACLLAYFSDMTGAAFRPSTMGTWGTHTDASIDHALWFHRPWRADEWSFFDLQTLVNAGGRATIRGTMHGEDGALHLSMAQELLIRELDEPLVLPPPPWTGRDSKGPADGTA